MSVCASGTLMASDSQAWFNINGTFKQKSWMGYLEETLRMANHAQNVGLNMVRTSIGREVLKQTSLHIGYGYISFNYPLAFFEHRYYLQQNFQYKFQGFPISFSERLRYEFRDIEHRPKLSQRARLFLKFNWLILEQIKTSLVFSNELFWNMNTIEATQDKAPATPAKGFDQNRAFIGLGKKLNDYSLLELGYLNNPVRQRYKKDILNHALAMNFIVNYP